LAASGVISPRVSMSGVLAGMKIRGNLFASAGTLDEDGRCINRASASIVPRGTDANLIPSRSSITQVDCFRNRILMSRSVRQFLFASLIACHAAVTLCGPCLHGLPGLSHKTAPVSNDHGPDDPIQSRSDAMDRCLICHFVAQGQLPVAFSGESPVQFIDKLVIPAICVSPCSFNPLPSSPRAPPIAVSGLS
jgi:hypothetical protein